MVCLDTRSVDVADYVSLVVHLGTLHLDGIDRFAVFARSSRMFIRRLNSDIIV